MFRRSFLPNHAPWSLLFARLWRAIHGHSFFSTVFVAALCAVFFPISPARAASFSAGQKAEIEAIVKDYLLQKPEILREAIGVLEAREKEAQAKEREKIVSDPSSTLFSPTSQAIIGNPDGKIMLIEFFDYNCGYCKRALSDLARLMRDNPDLRVVLRDFPILSSGSVEAAQVANAFLRQFQGEKFWAFHQKLLSSRAPVGKAEALAVAKELGADMDKLAKDAADPGVAAGIAESEKFAKSLQVTGTPTYVIGGDVIVGAVGYDELQARVANIKKCGKVVCS